jgi:hypothetical protein
MKNKINAFGFIEIGFFLLIIGIIFSSILPLMKWTNTLGQQKEIIEKHKLITQSIAAYCIRYGQLPKASLPPFHGFSKDECYNGIVPYQTLGMSEKDVKDSKGNWFTYAVSEKLTQTLHLKNTKQLVNDNCFCTVLKSETDINILNYEIPNDDVAAFVLIAHNKGNGAIKNNGERSFKLKDSSKASRCEEINALNSLSFCIDSSNDTIFWITRNNFSAQHLQTLCEKTEQYEIIEDNISFE